MLLFPHQCHPILEENFNIELSILIIIMLFSLTANSLLMLSTLKGSAFRSKFYSIILSIGIADFLTGIVVAPSYIFLSYRFTRYKTVNITNSLFQTILFTVAGSAIISSSFMTIDRLIYLRNPEIYTSCLNQKRQRAILFSIWLGAFLFSLIQHAIDIFLYLVLFSVLIVIVTGIVMSVTLVTYWKHFNDSTKNTLSSISKIPSFTMENKHMGVRKTPSEEESQISSSQVDINHHSAHLNVLRNDSRKPSDTPSVATIPGATEDFLEEFQVTTIRPSITAIEIDKSGGKKQRGIMGKNNLYESRIIVTLAIITAAFWLFHLPFITASFYLYVNDNNKSQPECNSALPLHNLIFYPMLLSSGIRPLTFIIRLSKTRETLCNIFNHKNRRRRHYTLESRPIWMLSTLGYWIDYFLVLDFLF